jgi:Tfp pilus assembly protein PilV
MLPALYRWLHIEHSSTSNKWRGISTIELLTAVSVLAILMTAGYRIYQLSARTAELAQEYVKAELLARDLLEMTIAKRNEDWNVINAGEFYFVESAGEYIFTAGEETVGEFTRSVTISEVNRDVDGNIIASGGTLDNDVFKLESVVSWTYRDNPHQVALEQYITNWRRF